MCDFIAWENTNVVHFSCEWENTEHVPRIKCSLKGSHLIYGTSAVFSHILSKNSIFICLYIIIIIYLIYSIERKLVSFIFLVFLLFREMRIVTDYQYERRRVIYGQIRAKIDTHCNILALSHLTSVRWPQRLRLYQKFLLV